MSPRYVNKTCTVAVQVFVACLRALCSSDGAPSKDTCNTLKRLLKACRGERSRQNVRLLLFKTKCLPDTKFALNPPTTIYPWRFYTDLRGKGMEYLGRYTDLHCTIADLAVFIITTIAYAAWGPR